MKKIAALVLVAVFALGGVALAAEIEGTIQSVDSMNNAVVLDNGSTLTVDQDTKIMVSGNEGKLEDLQAGGKVKATYEEKDGKNMASTLEVSE
jgi:ABC-type Fe3+-hydroxamate transport system substrate-binding protein